MKLGFTTLACPTWELGTIISSAKQFGYDGVDFRLYLDEIALPAYANYLRKLMLPG